VAQSGRIPRITLPPPHKHGGETSAFARGPKERKILVVVDRETVRDGESADALLALRRLDEVEIISTDASDGYPHLTFELPEDIDRPVYVVLERERGARRTAAPTYKSALALAGLAPNERDNDTLAAVLLDRSAAAVGADALATRDPLLVGSARPAWAVRGNPMTPEEAAALVGLYLRLRGNFVFNAGSGFTANLNRSLFYWATTRAVLPASWRWTNACAASSRTTGDEATLNLAHAVLARFDRALRARDRMHEQLMLKASPDTLDEALFYFVIVLEQLGGAFDAVARVAHRAYSLSGSPATHRGDSTTGGSGNSRCKHLPSLRSWSTGPRPAMRSRSRNAFATGP